MAETHTVGQILVNESFPPEFRDYNRKLDKKGLYKVLEQLARTNPDKYRDTIFRLGKLSTSIYSTNGGYSMTVAHLQTPQYVKDKRVAFLNKAKLIMSDARLTEKQKHDKLLETGIAMRKDLVDELYKDALTKRNPAALTILGGIKGKPNNLNSLIGFDMFYEDAAHKPVVFPVLHSYSAGLRPSEYLAGSYGARVGVIDEKLSTQVAGAYAKQLARVVQRQLVTADDVADQNENIGLPALVSDGDNIGALLARKVGNYPRNTVITNKILADLENQGVKNILIRSPLTGGNTDGGLLARDVGIRETNRLSAIGENPGIVAAQAFAEPLSQGALSSKHTGGVYGFTSGAVTGFNDVTKLTDIPQSYSNGATHVEVDGRVQDIQPAPAGGWNVTVNGKKYYVYGNRKLTVKKGDELEAGDVISDGLPNPAKVVQYKGVGEGRRYFTKLFTDTVRNMGVTANRRNTELFARGLIDHIKLNDYYGSMLPGEVMSYNSFAANYEPRKDSVVSPVSAGLRGKYLEKPILHYTIGTQIKPSVLKELNEYGIKDVTVNNNPPPFEPEMISSKFNLLYDRDWLTKMYGPYQERGFLDSVATTQTADVNGTSALTGLALDPDFADGKGKVKSLAGPLKFEHIDLE